MSGASIPPPPMRPSLDREYLARAALAVIDSDGLDRFSMRRLGAAIGVDPMAAYRHFEDREALFDGVAEAIFAETDTASLPWESPWADLAEEYCNRLREALLRHPHAVAIFATRPLRSPESLQVGVRMLAKIEDAGVTSPDALRILRCLREYTVGHSLSVSTLQLGGQRRSRKPTVSDFEYNTLAKASDQTTPDDHFNIGLQSMLRGFTWQFG